MKVTKHDREWVCNDCGSEKLTEKAWVSLNHDITVDGLLSAKFIDCAYEMYWCDNCEDEATPIPYEDYKDKTDK